MQTELNEIDFIAKRADFPILQEINRGKPLIYLDSAASAQKPWQVIDAMNNFYLQDFANIHRGIYELSERATKRYEDTRLQVKSFIHGKEDADIIFVRGTTEAINLVAQSLGRSTWQAGDEIILSVLEHHSNIVPWYLLAQQIGVKLKVIPITQTGALDLSAYEKLFSKRTKFVSVSHVSNALGTIKPAKEIVRMAHAHGVPVLLDGAQALAHLPVNLTEIDCDFYAFSAHKLYGPTGTGVLYGKREYLEKMPPYQGGGDMIESVSFTNVTFAKSPQKFEAGTPDIASVIGLNAAIEYLKPMGMQAIYAHEQHLLAYLLPKLTSIPGLKIIGTAEPRVGVVSFVIDGIHPHDIATVLDAEGIAVRAGHHCAMPLMEFFKVPATVRVSFGIYNTKNDVDALIRALHIAKRLFE